MNLELKTKLLADLKKTGFGSELRASATLNKLDWFCRSSTCYFDKDEKKSREIDITAEYSGDYKLPSGKLIGVFFHLIIEIKKSEAPWIVFRRNYKHRIEGFCSWDRNLISTTNFPKNEQGDFSSFLTRHSLKMVCSWEGFGIHQAFKDPDSPSRWYSAATTVCKAAEHLFENGESSKVRTARLAETSREDFQNKRTSFSFFQPLVILDGPLFSAVVSPKGELKLEEIKAAPFDFTFQTASYKRRSYRVDLITLNCLGEYSRLTKKRIDDIYRGIKIASNQANQVK
jgi:hypothetical protein